jgi:hypothetical protein
MAFTRAYSARDMGDPFRLRIPAKLRKLKVGRALGKVARAGIGFIPGVGPVAAQLMGAAEDMRASRSSPVPEAAQLPAAGAEWDEENPGAGFTYIKPPPGHAAWSFARSNGWDMGDPRVLKRKMAAAGPRAKSARKANNRLAKSAGGGAGRLKGTSARGGKKAGRGGADFGRALAGFGAGAMEAFKHTADVARGGPGAIMGQAFNFEMPGKGKGSGAGIMPRAGGGGRRSMNMTNVHALKRGLRRLEGFEKLVKRIEKQYPRLKRATGHASSSRPGHKAGCRCVACK